VLSTRYAEHSFAVLVNMARSEFEARKTFTQLTRVAERFLHVSLRFAGYVPYDSEVPEAVRRQQAVIELAPATPATRAIEGSPSALCARPPGAGEGRLAVLLPPAARRRAAGIGAPR
jgi:flagellar biosynthesis protein FlhG